VNAVNVPDRLFENILRTPGKRVKGDPMIAPQDRPRSRSVRFFTERRMHRRGRSEWTVGMNLATGRRFAHSLSLSTITRSFITHGEASMYTASDLRKGLKIEIDGAPYVITDFQFVKPGKGQALYRCKMKNLINGATLDRTYRAVEKIDKPNLEERDLIYSYQDGEHFVFMDNATYEQIMIDADVLGDQRYFLVEDMEVQILFHNDRPIEVTLPFFIEKEVVETEPGARGDTATNVLKPAKIDNGYEIQVPLFIKQGDIVRIDTRTGKYADRVSKR